MKTLITSLLFLMISISAFSQRDGDCQCFQETVFAPSDTQRILISEAEYRHDLVPATYETITETKLVRPATVEYVVDDLCNGCWRDVAAVYKTITKKTKVSDAYLVPVLVQPAVYEDLITEVIVNEPRLVIVPVAGCSGTVIR